MDRYMKYITNKSILFTILFMVYSVVNGNLSTYKSCCNVCRPDQDLWVENHRDGSWVLSVDGKKFHNLLQPAAYIVDEEAVSDVVLYKRKYNIRYSGIPVRINETSLSEAVLQAQYAQLDLTVVSNLAGVVIQGGHYEDTENDLFDTHYSWVTKFAVSHSMDGETYNWHRDLTSKIAIYDGLTRENQYKMQDIGNVITTRYVRIHPLGAEDEHGMTALLMMRIGAITCSMDPICIQPRYPCILNDWQEWGPCVCDWARCKETRVRTIARYPACGGKPCGDTSEKRTCIPPEPQWKSTMKIVGIVIPMVLLVIIICLCLYKKLKKLKKEPEVFIKKNMPRSQKEKKERKLRSDLAAEDRKEGLEETGDDEEEIELETDFLEKDLTPTATKSLFTRKHPKIDGITDIDSLEDEILDMDTPVKKDKKDEIETIDELESEIINEVKPKKSALSLPSFATPGAKEVKEQEDLEAEILGSKPSQPTQPKNDSPGFLGQLDASKMTVVGIDGNPVQKKKKKKKNKHISFDLPPLEGNQDQPQAAALPGLKLPTMVTPSQPGKPSQPSQPSASMPSFSAHKPLGNTPFGMKSPAVNTKPETEETYIGWDDLETEELEIEKEEPPEYDDIYL